MALGRNSSCYVNPLHEFASKRLPTWLVSLGSTTSVLMVSDWEEVLLSLLLGANLGIIHYFAVWNLLTLKRFTLFCGLLVCGAVLHRASFYLCLEAQTRESLCVKHLPTNFCLCRRLWYIIGWPALVGSYVLVCGFWWAIFAYYFSQSWMWLKLICLAALTVYHLQCQSILTQQKKGGVQIPLLCVEVV